MSKIGLLARLLPGFLVITFLAGCGGTPAAPVIGVAVSPTSVTLIGGASQTFAATVTNDSASAGVTWTASAGAITSAGVYTAPSPVTTTSATVTATSKTDPTKTASATITLTLISVSASPTTATLAAGATQTFTATVTADGANAGVTWTASVGSITSGGVYTAPTPVTTATATITATSKTDTTKTGTATVTLTPITVSVAPTTATLIGGATQTFTPTVTDDATLNQGVTWTASTGTITSGGVYTAPAVITTTSATVTATSKTDPTKTGTAAITLTPISVNAISPATASLGVSGSQAFTDTVANDGSNSGVTWSIGTGVGTLSASSTTGVTYNAPTTVISSVTTVILTATSIKDPTKSTTATITLNPISVSISPASPAAMAGGATQAFTATVASDGSNSGITWTVTGGGSFSAGSTASGVATNYTAGSPVTTAAAVVTATSVKDPSKTASATITLNPIAVSFSTVTTGITLDSGQTLALAATVANDSSASGATFASVGAGIVSPSTAAGNSPATTLTATGAVASTVTVTATSIKDPTKSATTASIAVNPALAITTLAGALAGGTTGMVYAGATIAATGGSGGKTFAIASGALPIGLSISPTTGAISGTPSGTAGTSTFTVKVTDSATTPVTVTSGTYTIAITAAPPVWVSPTTGTLTYTVGTPITPITLSTTGGTGTITYSVNSGSLPQGLQIVGNQVTGTPTAPTVVSGNVVSFLATDSATPTAVTAVSAAVTLIANPVTLAITSSSLPTGTVGAAYSYQLISTGGTGAITWSLSAGSLTGTGLTLSGTGLLSGTPTTTQSGLSLTFQAKDSATNQQQTVTKTLSLTATNALTITTTQSVLPYAYVNQAYTPTTLVAAGGTGSGQTWLVTTGLTGTNSLQTLNLTVSPTGVITGTPTVAGIANFTVKVTDSASNTASATYTIQAYTPLSLPTPSSTVPGPATTTANYTGSITVTGGVPNYAWTVNGCVSCNSISLGNGSLSASPNGATLNITGTPASAGTVSFTASVTDNASHTVGPTTYTIAVTSNYSVGGNINLNNNCSSSSPPTISLTLTHSGTTIGTATSDSNGNFAFTNIPNGTYTVTPSISGPSAIFYPTSQAVSVGDNNVINANFTVSLGYTVSGTVTYSGSVSQTNPIYLSLGGGCNNGNGNPGTSIPAAGTYTIHGVPPGTYTLSAYQDNLGFGSQNAANPTGSTSNEAVATANLTTANVTLSPSGTVTLSAAPGLQEVAGFNNGAFIQYKAISSNNIEQATTYTLQWSATNTFTAIAGSKTFPATGAGGTNMWFVNSAMTTTNGCTNCSTLTNGSVYFFRVFGTAGTSTSSYGIFNSSGTPVAVTIGAPTGGVTVSGSVTYPGTATGPLYVGFYNYNTGVVYGEYIASPSSPSTAYTISVPVGSAYYFIGVIDQNNNGVVDAGDINNVINQGNPPTENITVATSSENLTLTASNSLIQTYTGHTIQTGQSDNYSVNAIVNTSLKLPVAVELISATNPDVIVPQDIAVAFQSGHFQFQWQGSTQTTVPAVGDSYGLKVTYSDGTSDASLPATVTAVLTSAAAATSLSAPGAASRTTPTFSWIYPTNAGNYTYQFSICCSNNGTIWQIPGSNSNVATNGFTSSQITPPLVWGTDPTDSTNTPTGPLSTGTQYNWDIETLDNNNDYVQVNVSYTP